jgi:hypothetical protein
MRQRRNRPTQHFGSRNGPNSNWKRSASVMGAWPAGVSCRLRGWDRSILPGFDAVRKLTLTWQFATLGRERFARAWAALRRGHVFLTCDGKVIRHARAARLSVVGR